IFHEHTVTNVLPKFNLKTISESTSIRWIYKIGFRPQKHTKSLYYDGHKRADVVKSQKKYLDDVSKLRLYSFKYEGNNCEIAVQVDPEILGDNRETVFLYHDESTVHAQERPQLSWLLPGTTELQSKSQGCLIHISDFILELTGRLVLLQQQQHSLQLLFNDAATVIYPGSQGDAWWDMQQLCNQVSKKALPIFNALHPGCQAVFVFDCSAAHKSYGPSVLRVQNMNLGSGGKQAKPKDTWIPCDDPHIPESLRGQRQTMVFPSDYHIPALASQPKGVQQVLTEQGPWQHYSDKRLKACLPNL
ncbi:hypothetical protein PTTG_10164, partial [Puccinia triticina 1-1 BBBD Race 1]